MEKRCRNLDGNLSTVQTYKQILISLNKLCLQLHLSLQGRARVATSELTVAELKEDGVKKLLEKFDSLFLHGIGRRSLGV